MTNSRNSRRDGYQRLDQVEAELLPDDSYFPRRPFPRYEIILGWVLLALGTFLMGLGALIYLAHWQNRVPGSAQAYICLGLLVFIPGAYASAIATCAYFGVQGVTYDMMPQMPRS
eukprot:TRINITY_DN45656_c0_g1_i1.p3 TRINITY_DN45656_c0_g1~~TRINITY_DN45656_c0_g1_i1.p3  ORF type:complete len:115 (-),score=3.26 TRINITY_DN45656_c0_g1_i1:268-612(-)